MHSTQTACQFYLNVSLLNSSAVLRTPSYFRPAFAEMKKKEVLIGQSMLIYYFGLAHAKKKRSIAVKTCSCTMDFALSYVGKVILQCAALVGANLLFHFFLYCALRCAIYFAFI